MHTSKILTVIIILLMAPAFASSSSDQSELIRPGCEYKGTKISDAQIQMAQPDFASQFFTAKEILRRYARGFWLGHLSGALKDCEANGRFLAGMSWSEAWKQSERQLKNDQELDMDTEEAWLEKMLPNNKQLRATVLGAHMTGWYDGHVEGIKHFDNEIAPMINRGLKSPDDTEAVWEATSLAVFRKAKGTNVSLADAQEVADSLEQHKAKDNNQ